MFDVGKHKQLGTDKAESTSPEYKVVMWEWIYDCDVQGRGLGSEIQALSTYM